jgi:hypothetical protein
MTLTPVRRLVGSLFRIFRIALFAPLLLRCDDEQVRAHQDHDEHGYD